MEFKTCLYVPKKKIYIVKNSITGDNYVFIGKYSPVDSLINKLNDKEKLTGEEIKLMQKYYDIDKSLLNNSDENTQFIKSFINLDDDIYTIKKKITKYIYNETEPNKQHLYITKVKINKDEQDIVLKRIDDNIDLINPEFINNNNVDLKEYSIMLGLTYRNEDGIKLLPCDINNLKKLILPNYDDNLYDTHSFLLENHGNIKNNVINIVRLEDLPDNLSEEFYKLYFPFNKETNVVLENFNDIISLKNDNDIRFENMLFNIDEKYKNKSCLLTNVVIKGNLLNDYFTEIDLNNIFINIELDNTVQYVKYFNEYYKFHRNSKKIISKPIARDFKNSDKYIVPYEKGLYEPVAPKTYILNWVKKDLLFREKQFLKEQKYYDSEYLKNTIDELCFKIAYKDDYFDFIINKMGICYIRLLFVKIKIDESLLKDIYAICNKLIKKINNLSIYTFYNLYKTNTNFLTLNTEYKIDIPSTKLNNIKNSLNQFINYCYLDTFDKKQNTIDLKYTKVNTFNTLINYKNFFYKLKQNNLELSVKDFETLWKRETNHIFSLSEIESIQILRTILEEYKVEDLKKSRVDYEVDIKISKNFTNKETNLDNFSIIVENCYNLQQLARIKEFVNCLLLEAVKTKIVIKDSVENVIKPIEIKQTKFTTDDDLDFDDDFLDLEDFEEDEPEPESEIEEEDINIAELEEKVEIEEEDDLHEDEDEFKQKKRSIRNYMSSMRKMDPKLFKYKTKEDDKYDSYSIKCGAVDMRQPIILTKSELVNFEKKNPDAFNKLQKLEWGSSINSKNFYMCPRIWCIRDKIALTDEQLIKNKGKCPFCQGEIIDSQEKEIMENKTVIIRRAGTNKYWANPSIKKTQEWSKYLYETEKEAYPGFLDPKLHPSGLCMPCCNANKYWNFSKCFIVPIDFMLRNFKNIVPGERINNVLVKENDTILFLTDTIYTIKKDSMEKTETFTKLNLPLQEGMTVKIVKEPKKKFYDVKLVKNQYKFSESSKTKSQDERYIIGEDKFPLPEGKIGVLPKSVDNIFDNRTIEKINKSKLKNNVGLFTRRGVNQIPFNSFLCCMATLKDMTLEQLITQIIKNLEPEEYLDLNNGDIFKMFVAHDQKLAEEHKLSFQKWCTIYSSFYNKYKKNKELVQQVYYSFENFKNFCGNMNVQKESIFFQDLLSKQNEWFFKKGLNILIIERKVIASNDKIYLHIPQVDSVKSLYNDYDSTCILYKYRGIYELINYSKTVNTIGQPYFYNYFNINKLIDMNAIQRIKNMVKLVISNGNPFYNTKVNYSKLENVKELEQKYADNEPSFYVYDDYNKGIGLLLKNNVILFSIPFSINRYKRLDKININEVPLLSHEELIQNLDSLNINYNKSILDNGNIIGLTIENGYIHPIKKQKFESLVNINYEELNYPLASDENLIEFNNIISENEFIYNQFTSFKKELSNLFNSRSKSFQLLKKILNIYITNSIIPINVKRSKIYSILKNIINNITIDDNVYYKSNKVCGKLSSKSCVKTKKCKYNKTINKGLNMNLEGIKFTLNFPKCKMKLAKRLQILFLNKIVDDLIFSIVTQKEIFEGKFIKKNIVMNDIVNKENLNSELKSFYKGSNFYLVNDVTNIRPVYLLNDELIKEIKNSSEVFGQNIENVYSTTITDTNIDMSRVSDVKGGLCLFPYKIKNRDIVETYDQCIPHENALHGRICATEKDDDGFMTKYGFCNNKTKPKPKPKPTVQTNVAVPKLAQAAQASAAQAPSKPKKNNASSKSKLYTVNGKECIIPYKIKNVEYNECEKLKTGESRCPISVNLKRKPKKWELCDIDDNPDLTNWEGPYIDKYLWSHKNNVIKETGKIKTLTEAIRLSENYPDCQGITFKSDTGVYTLRRSKKLRDYKEEPKGLFKSWIKKS